MRSTNYNTPEVARGDGDRVMLVRDARAIPGRTLAGAPQDGDSTKSGNLAKLTRFIAMCLAVAPQSARYSIMKAAMSQASGRREVLPPMWAVLVPGEDWDQSRNTMSAIGALQMAIPMSSSKTTVPELISIAESLASGTPITGDPTSSGLAHLPTSAHAAMEASRIDPEVAEAIASTPGAEDFLKSIEDAYDCHNHAYILGGDVLAGAGKFWQKIGKGIQRAAKWTIEKFGDPQSDSTETTPAVTTSTAAEAESTTPSNLGTTTQVVVNDDGSASAVDGSGKVVAVADSVKDLVSQLDSQVATALESMKKLATLSQEEELKAAEAKRKRGMLTWALSMLEADPEVADLLADQTPSTSNLRSWFSTMWKVISDANVSQDSSTIAALADAIKLSQTSGGLSADTLKALLGGDPRLSPASAIVEMFESKAGMADPANAADTIAYLMRHPDSEGRYYRKGGES